MPADKVGIRIVMYGIMRHLFSLLAQQVPVVQAGLRIITHSQTTLKPSLSRYSMNASIDKIT
ncbi:hypothetical protein [Escherichia coli]|uniref:hypothetical protein n=1 Tax=Escherichia coli TaxID=562 RepID=UPI00201A25B2|nr:hypothetical protein [Escherichia coli]